MPHCLLGSQHQLKNDKKEIEKREMFMVNFEKAYSLAFDEPVASENFNMAEAAKAHAAVPKATSVRVMCASSLCEPFLLHGGLHRGGEVCLEDRTRC